MAKYIIINATKSFQQIRNKLKKEKKKNPEKLMGISGFDDELNRKILEKEKIDIFLPLLENRKDFSKQRNSGFNQVMAKICKKNKILLGINLDEIINSRNKPAIIARIKQNINLCKKEKLRMAFFGENKRSKQELHSLSLVLGMPTWMPFFFN